MNGKYSKDLGNETRKTFKRTIKAASNSFRMEFNSNRVWLTDFQLSAMRSVTDMIMANSLLRQQLAQFDSFLVSTYDEEISDHNNDNTLRKCASNIKKEIDVIVEKIVPGLKAQNLKLRKSLDQH